MEFSKISPAPQPFTGRPQLPATATVERSLTPLFSESRTTSSLELVLQDPRHPEALSILAQEVLQQRREMGLVVGAGQQLQRQVVAQDQQLETQEKELAAVRQAGRRLQERVSTQERELAAQKRELVALRNDQKKQAFIRIADRHIRECDSAIKGENRGDLSAIGLSCGGILMGIFTGGLIIPFVVIASGAGLSHMYRHDHQEWQKVRWILRTFPEVVEHDEFGMNASQIFDTYMDCREKLLGRKWACLEACRQEYQNAYELLVATGARLKIIDSDFRDSESVVSFNLFPFGSTEELRECISSVTMRLNELNEQIGQLEHAIAHIYETPVFLSEEEFEDELGPPHEFFEGRRQESQENIEQAIRSFRAAQRKSKRWAPHCQVEIIYCLIKWRKVNDAKNLIEAFGTDFPTNDENVMADILVLQGTVFLWQEEYLRSERCFQEARAKYKHSSHLIKAAPRLLLLDPLHPFAFEVLYRNTPRPINEELLRNLVKSLGASLEKFPGCVALSRNLIDLHLDLLRFESKAILRKERLIEVSLLMKKAAESPSFLLSAQDYLLLSEAWLKVIFDCEVDVDSFEEFLSHSEGNNAESLRKPSTQENLRSLARGQRMFIFLLRALTLAGQNNKKKDFTDCILGIAQEMRRFDLSGESLYSPFIEDSEMKVAPRRLNERLTTQVINLGLSIRFLDKDPLYSFLQFIVRITVADARLFALLAELSDQLGKKEESQVFCRRALDLNPANQKVSQLLVKLEKEGRPTLPVVAALTSPQLMASSVAHVEPIVPSIESAEIVMFVTRLSRLMQNSLQHDRGFYTGESGRRTDNLDRAIEVTAGAVDASASPKLTLAVNAARVGVGAARNLLADLVASKTIEFESEDIGDVCKLAAQLVAKRYKSQIVQLVPSSIEAFATYCHQNAVEKLHSLIKEPIKDFCRWLIGKADRRNFLPKQKLFFAFVTPNGKGPVLTTKVEREIGDGWSADELLEFCGREFEGKKYMLPDSQKYIKKYGFCHCIDKEEIEKLRPLPEEKEEKR